MSLPHTQAIFFFIAIALVIYSTLDASGSSREMFGYHADSFREDHHVPYRYVCVCVRACVCVYVCHSTVPTVGGLPEIPACIVLHGAPMTADV